MTLNTRSVRKKTASLKVLIDDANLDVLLLQETWLTQGDLSIYAELAEMGFKINKLERTIRKGGGLAILIKSTIYRQLSFHNSFKYDSFDNIVTSFTVGKIRIIIANIYRPPDKSKSLFITHLDDFLCDLLEIEGSLLIAGDFNIDFLSTDNITRNIRSTLVKHGLVQIVEKPTRGDSLIDYFVIQSSFSSLYKTFLTHTDFPSDHIPLFLNLSINALSPSQHMEMIEYRDYKSIDYDILRSKILDSGLCDIKYLSLLSSSQCVEFYNSVISNIINDLCPSKKIPLRRDISTRYYTPHLRRLKQKRRQVERKFRKSPNNQILAENYKKARNLYTCELKLSRINFFAQKVNAFQHDSKNLYKVLNELTGNKREVILPAKHSSSLTAKEMADFYVNKVVTIRQNICKASPSGPYTTKDAPSIANNTLSQPNISLFSTVPSLSSLLSSPFQTINNINSFSSFNKVTSDELKNMISRLKKKTCSLDPAPTNVLMNVFDVLQPFYLKVINKSITECSFPKPLKQAVVSPIIKNSTLDPEAYSSYRPVSSLPFFAKLQEMAIHDQLNSYIDDSQLYGKYQSAYKSNHSCETALVKIVNDIKVSNLSGDNVIIVLLDSSAAFDTVDHTILLHKLKTLFNIENPALNYIHSYLVNRSFMIKIKKEHSTPRDLSFGVPQGSLLGPLFYNLYTKEIENIILQHGLKVHSYADDIQMYTTFKSDGIDKMKLTLKGCLDDVKLWMDNNFLKLNSDKTLVKIFWADPKAMSTFPVRILEYDIKDTIKVLGVTINGDLSFMEFIAKKVQTCNFHLRNLWNIRGSLNIKTRTMMVTNLILSTIDYCNILLISCNNKQLRPLKLVINRSIRFIYNINFKEHITPYYKKLHFLPIRQRIQFKACLLGYKIFYRQAPEYLIDEFTHFEPNIHMMLREGQGRDRYMFDVDRHAMMRKDVLSLIINEWNGLPLSLRRTEAINSFKTGLKSKLFSDF